MNKTLKKIVWIGIFLVIFIIAIYQIAASFDISGTNFNLGIYNKTFYNSTILAVTLTQNDSEQELPNYGQDEKAGLYGGINMTGCVLLMHLNNDSSVGENNGFVYDWSGKNNHGNVSGAVVNNSGKLGKAYQFKQDQSINISISPSINISSRITVAAWVKFHSLIDYGDIITKYTEGYDDPWAAYQLQLDQLTYAGNPRFAISNGSVFADGGWQVVDARNSNFRCKVDTWYHFAGTYNETHISLYVDGILMNQSETKIRKILTNTIPVVVGSRLTSDSIIDEAAIWNRSLSEQEIREIYLRQKGKYIHKGQYVSEVFDTIIGADWNKIN